MNDFKILRVTSSEEAATAVMSVSDNCIVTKPEVDLMAMLAEVRFLISDFDGTIIPGGSLWRQTDAYLPEEIRAAVKERFRHYRREQETTSLDVPLNLFRHVRFAVDKYIDARFERALLHQIAEQLQMRRGFRQLHALMDYVAVVSVGFAETIEHMMDYHGLPCEVMGTRIEFDKDGCACSYKPTDVMVDTTKGHAAIAFISKNGSPAFSKVMIIGDTINDMAMMIPGMVRVLLVDPKGVVLPNRGPDYITTMWNKLDMILVADNFKPLVELIEEARHT